MARCIIISWAAVIALSFHIETAGQVIPLQEPVVFRGGYGVRLQGHRRQERDYSCNVGRTAHSPRLHLSYIPQLFLRSWPVTTLERLRPPTREIQPRPMELWLQKSGTALRTENPSKMAERRLETTMYKQRTILSAQPQRRVASFSLKLRFVAIPNSWTPAPSQEKSMW
ncbi:hypothetical protein R3P38DRAFT_322581 [Favolaschia claudopus]|uniref:Uncharacterized protein n=1 Tax=Favolaschia claudopus TaxID=2862362 RepID=A0AAW0CRY1_9AGAR